MEDAAAFNIPAEALPPDQDFGAEGFGIWPENRAAVEAFLAVSSQWRSTALPMGGVLWLGLDYAAVQAGLALSGADMTPDLFAQVQLIELGAKAALNGTEDEDLTP